MLQPIEVEVGDEVVLDTMVLDMTVLDTTVLDIESELFEL